MLAVGIAWLVAKLGGGLLCVLIASQRRWINMPGYGLAVYAVVSCAAMIISILRGDLDWFSRIVSVWFYAYFLYTAAEAAFAGTVLRRVELHNETHDVEE
jgi:hypothetical protein